MIDDKDETWGSGGLLHHYFLFRFPHGETGIFSPFRPSIHPKDRKILGSKGLLITTVIISSVITHRPAGRPGLGRQTTIAHTSFSFLFPFSARKTSVKKGETWETRTNHYPRMCKSGVEILFPHGVTKKKRISDDPKTHTLSMEYVIAGVQVLPVHFLALSGPRFPLVKNRLLGKTNYRISSL